MRYITAEQFGELPAWLKDQYKEVKEGEKKGQYELAKPPEGYQPKEKVDEFRNNNIELLRRIEALESQKGGESEETAALRARLQEIEQEKLKEAGKWDEWRAAHEKNKAEALDKVKKELDGARGELKTFKLNGKMRSAALDAGIALEHVDDVVALLADRQVKLTDKGEFEIFDLDGVPFTSDLKTFFGDYYKGKRPIYYEGANPAGGGTTQDATRTQPQTRGGKKVVGNTDQAALGANLEAIARGEVEVAFGG
jgi:hypothetical protein